MTCTPVGRGDGFPAESDAETVGILLQPFAAWCGGVVLGDPQVDDTWELVDGVVEITEVDESGAVPSATMTASGLVAVDADGERHELGDIVLVNNAWGMIGE